MATFSSLFRWWTEVGRMSVSPAEAWRRIERATVSVSTGRLRRNRFEGHEGALEGVQSFERSMRRVAHCSKWTTPTQLGPVDIAVNSVGKDDIRTALVENFAIRAGAVAAGEARCSRAPSSAVRAVAARL